MNISLIEESIPAIFTYHPIPKVDIKIEYNNVKDQQRYAEIKNYGACTNKIDKEFFFAHSRREIEINMHLSEDFGDGKICYDIHEDVQLQVTNLLGEELVEALLLLNINQVQTSEFNKLIECRDPLLDGENCLLDIVKYEEIAINNNIATPSIRSYASYIALPGRPDITAYDPPPVVPYSKQFKVQVIAPHYDQVSEENVFDFIVEGDFLRSQFDTLKLNASEANQILNIRDPPGIFFKNLINNYYYINYKYL